MRGFVNVIFYISWYKTYESVYEGKQKKKNHKVVLNLILKYCLAPIFEGRNNSW